MTIQEALKVTRKILKENGLVYWTATTNRRKSAFGVCNYSKTQIELSVYLTPQCTDEAIMDTIYHEVAHALTRGHSHNNVWRKKCIELGGSGNRCSGSEKTKTGKLEIKTKYTLVCPICDNKIPISRKPKYSSSCSNHGSRNYDEKYKLKLIQHY